MSVSCQFVNNCWVSLVPCRTILKSLLESDSPQRCKATAFSVLLAFLWLAGLWCSTHWSYCLLQNRFHPNVYSDGTLCLDIIQEAWSPCHNVCTILTSIQSLLTDPNCASPANPDAAQAYQHKRKEYNRTVRRISQRSLDSWHMSLPSMHLILYIKLFSYLFHPFWAACNSSICSVVPALSLCTSVYQVYLSSSACLEIPRFLSHIEVTHQVLGTDSTPIYNL